MPRGIVCFNMRQVTVWHLPITRTNLLAALLCLLFLRVAAALCSDRGLDGAIFGTDLLTLQTWSAATAMEVQDIRVRLIAVLLPPLLPPVWVTWLPKLPLCIGACEEGDARKPDETIKEDKRNRSAHHWPLISCEFWRRLYTDCIYIYSIYMFSLPLVAIYFWREPKAGAVLWVKFGIREKRWRMQGSQDHNSFKKKRNCKGEVKDCKREWPGALLGWKPEGISNGCQEVAQRGSGSVRI